MRLAVMRFLANRELISVYKEAHCDNCSWSINSRQTKETNYVGQRAREHTQEYGHYVEVTSTRTTVYSPAPKETRAQENNHVQGLRR